MIPREPQEFADRRPGMLAMGGRAPEFTLPDQDEQSVSLSTLLRHGPLILYFYPADFTPGCTREACAIRLDCRDPGGGSRRRRRESSDPGESSRVPRKAQAAVHPPFRRRQVRHSYVRRAGAPGVRRASRHLSHRPGTLHSPPGTRRFPHQSARRFHPPGRGAECRWHAPHTYQLKRSPRQSLMRTRWARPKLGTLTTYKTADSPGAAATVSTSVSSRIICGSVTPLPITSTVPPACSRNIRAAAARASRALNTSGARCSRSTSGAAVCWARRSSLT